MRIAILASAIALGAIVPGAAPAAAASFALALAGDPTGGSASHFTIGRTRYDNFYLPLTGLDASNAITVAQGDTLTEAVSFAPAFTVPASQTFTFFGLYLTGGTFPTENTGVTGTTNFYNGLTLVKQGATGTTTSTQLVDATVEGPPFNTSWTFDSLTSAWTITTLATPATLDRAFVSYQLSSTAVPEPANWALLVTGFIVVGTLARRRRIASVAA